MVGRDRRARRDFFSRMSAYVIVDLEIVDPVGFQQYREGVVDTVEKYGGEYIAVSDAVETLEGDWKPSRIVLIEFESMQRAKDWLGSDEYRKIAPIRHRTCRTNMILVDGV
jgi:uncharacterized protein (DUF1330 family)